MSGQSERSGSMANNTITIWRKAQTGEQNYGTKWGFFSKGWGRGYWYVVGSLCSWIVSCQLLNALIHMLSPLPAGCPFGNPACVRQSLPLPDVMGAQPSCCLSRLPAQLRLFSSIYPFSSTVLFPIPLCPALTVLLTVWRTFLG